MRLRVIFWVRSSRVTGWSSNTVYLKKYPDTTSLSSLSVPGGLGRYISHESDILNLVFNRIAEKRNPVVLNFWTIDLNYKIGFIQILLKLLNLIPCGNWIKNCLNWLDCVYIEISFNIFILNPFLQPIKILGDLSLSLWAYISILMGIQVTLMGWKWV